MFQILYTLEAKERLSEIVQSDPKSARIIFDHIKKLPQTYRTDPFLQGVHFKGLRRNRIGRYRFIYRVLENEKEIRIVTINLRKSIHD
ncbi:MAG: type II toxin-antitoxin system RelE/ParE family toxin [Candidatus Omnitrophica bacterium]|nr:type II toxin-antitoxin system RelE/ParE family toxin [Candidatus Omnitrophota bacterium]